MGTIITVGDIIKNVIMELPEDEECIRKKMEHKLKVLATGNGYNLVDYGTRSRDGVDKGHLDEYKLIKPTSWFKSWFHECEWSTHFYYNPYTFEITLKVYDQVWYDKLVPSFIKIFGDDFNIKIIKNFCQGE